MRSGMGGGNESGQKNGCLGALLMITSLALNLCHTLFILASNVRVGLLSDLRSFAGGICVGLLAVPQLSTQVLRENKNIIFIILLRILSCRL